MQKHEREYLQALRDMLPKGWSVVQPTGRFKHTVFEVVRPDGQARKVALASSPSDKDTKLTKAYVRRALQRLEREGFFEYA